MRPRPPLALAALSPKDLKALQNRASALLISESPALRLLCVADSNPPARLGWFRASPALNATRISSTKILELPGLGAAEGEFTCRAQNPLGSQNTSVSLSVVCECGSPWGQDTWAQVRGEAPLTLLPLYRPPAAAGTLLLPGG